MPMQAPEGQLAANQIQTQPEDGGRSLDHLSESDMAYIKQLRNENATRRQEHQSLQEKMQGYDERFQAQNEQLQQYQDSMKQMLGIEEELSPQDAALHYQENYEAQEFQNSILTAAYQNGIPPENLDYFEFCIQKELATGNDLTEESFGQIVQNVKGMGQSQQQSIGGFNQQPSSAQGTPAAQIQVTPEQFKKMSNADLSEMRSQNPAQYKKLLQQSIKHNALF